MCRKLGCGGGGGVVKPNAAGRARALAIVALLALLLAGGGRARADGAFPDAQSVLLPANRTDEIILAANFGLVFSEDGGEHWQYSCETQATLNGRLYNLGATPDNRIFSLSDHGVATTADMGCSWRLGAGPFEGGLVRDYFPDPVDPSHVVVVAEPPGLEGLMPAQVFESRDGGLSYPSILHPGESGGGITGVEIARTDPRVIYVTLFTVGPADTLAHPILARTTDGGATWETIDLEPMLGASRVGLAAVDPTDASRIFLRVSGTNPELRSVDSIAVSADGGATFTKPVNLTGGTLIAFIARANGTVIASGLLGATPVGYRSRDRGMTFESWSPGLHARGFGERGPTLFVAADNSQDGFALASSEDDGDTWTPRMHFGQIEAVRSCTQQACVEDCWQKVTYALFPPAVCGEPPPVEPGTNGGAAATGESGCACSGGGPVDGRGALWMLIGAAVLARCLRQRRSRNRGAGKLGAMVLISAMLAPGQSAASYVRMKTEAGVPYHLGSTCLAIEVHLAGFPGVTDDQVRAAVAGAARAWTAETNSCTDLAIALTFRDGAGPAASNDGTNVIGARADGWCQGTGDPPPDAAATCNAPSATAATSVFATADGRIVGGDTQLNTLTVTWAALDDAGNPTDREDLQSALTHEIGHLIGLDHPCWSGIGERATDDRGEPVPDCYGATDVIRADTMFPTIDPGDISKRALSPEALRAICALYPASSGVRPPSAPATACPVSNSGCSVVPTAPPDLAPLVLLVTVSACAARRRHGASHG